MVMLEGVLTMDKMRMRVPSDKIKKFKEEHEEMGMGNMIEVIPTSLYGQRTMYPKGTDLKEVERDIHETYGH